MSSESNTWSQERFESARIDLFAQHGFDGRPRRIADRDQGDTYTLVREDGGTPLVLVHGGLADASVWYSIAAKLPGAVVIPDRPGCGLSHAMDYRSVDYRRAAADWLLSLVDGLGADRVDLVGNSMGGFFSMAFALAHPERVRRLVLAGAPAGLDRRLPLFLRLLGRPVIGNLLSAIDMTDPEVVRKRIFSDLMAHPERISRPALEVGIASSRFPASKLCARTMLGNVSDFGGWRPELMMREPMTSLAVPTLFAWGEKDSFAPQSSGKELAKRMPDACFEVIADAGHLVQNDAPDALADAIRRFLGEAKPQHAAA